MMPLRDGDDPRNAEIMTITQDGPLARSRATCCYSLIDQGDVKGSPFEVIDDPCDVDLKKLTCNFHPKAKQRADKPERVKDAAKFSAKTGTWQHKGPYNNAKIAQSSPSP